MKSASKWVEHLTSLQKRGGWALFRLLPHLTMKEHPRHVYSDSKPLKPKIGHKITYNGITSGFEAESWRHTTLWMPRWDAGEHSVTYGAHRISYVILRKDPLHWFRWSITRCFLPEICIVLEAVLLKLHATFASGWVLIWVNFDPIQEIGPKVGGGRSFVSRPFFARLQ